MIHHEILPDLGILVVQPEGRIESGDFTELAASVDPFIESHGDLRGLLIDAEEFPGWADFSAMLAHLQFVKDHHRHIAKVAALSDSTILSIFPALASHFVKAEVRHFEHNHREEAFEWLAS